MKSTLRLIAPYLALSCLATLAPAAEPGFRSLFNGVDLAGWSGNSDFWSVRDGAITGRSTVETPLKGNTFIVWQGGQVTNFELHAKFTLVANNDKNFANSGVQYRSRRLPEITPWTILGYQCDVHPTDVHTAMTYEERGRGVFGYNGVDVVMDPTG